MRKTWLILSFLIIGVMIGGCGSGNSTAQDQAALDSLREAGSEMTMLHPFDFYIYHHDKAGAKQICTLLLQDGFEVIVREGAGGDDWLCFASLSFVPSFEKLSELQEKFENLTSQYGGEYDGWETIVIP